MTLVKLTTSLAAVRPATTASTPSRAGRGSALAAAAPSMAPSAFAPASPEHRALAKVLRQQRGRSRQRRGRSRRDRAPVAASSAAGQQRDLDGPAGPQVKQVQQVSAAGHQASVDQRRRPPRARRTLPSIAAAPRPARRRDQRGGEASRADARDLHGAGRQLALPAARLDAPRKPLLIPVPSKIVIATERGGARARHGQRDPRARAAPAAGDAPAMPPIASGRPFEQRDGLAAMIRAIPGRAAARRPGAAGQRRRAAPRPRQRRAGPRTACGSRSALLSAAGGTAARRRGRSAWARDSGAVPGSMPYCAGALPSSRYVQRLHHHDLPALGIGVVHRRDRIGAAVLVLITLPRRSTLTARP